MKSKDELIRRAMAHAKPKKGKKRKGRVLGGSLAAEASYNAAQGVSNRSAGNSFSSAVSANQQARQGGEGGNRSNVSAQTGNQGEGGSQQAAQQQAAQQAVDNAVSRAAVSNAVTNPNAAAARLGDNPMQAMAAAGVNPAMAQIAQQRMANAAGTQAAMDAAVKAIQQGSGINQGNAQTPPSPPPGFKSGAFDMGYLVTQPTKLEQDKKVAEMQKAGYTPFDLATAKKDEKAPANSFVYDSRMTDAVSFASKDLQALKGALELAAYQNQRPIAVTDTISKRYKTLDDGRVVENPNSAHPLRKGLDFSLYDPVTGQTLQNIYYRDNTGKFYDKGGLSGKVPQDPRGFRDYEKIAQDVYRNFGFMDNGFTQKDLRWGGYFGPGGTEMDIMHLDTLGRSRNMLGGNFQSGLTASQRRAFPGAQSYGINAPRTTPAPVPTPVSRAEGLTRLGSSGEITNPMPAADPYAATPMRQQSTAINNAVNAARQQALQAEEARKAMANAAASQRFYNASAPAPAAPTQYAAPRMYSGLDKALEYTAMAREIAKRGYSPEDAGKLAFGSAIGATGTRPTMTGEVINKMNEALKDPANLEALRTGVAKTEEQAKLLADVEAIYKNFGGQAVATDSTIFSPSAIATPAGWVVDPVTGQVKKSPGFQVVTDKPIAAVNTPIGVYHNVSLALPSSVKMTEQYKTIADNPNFAKALPASDVSTQSTRAAQPVSPGAREGAAPVTQSDRYAANDRYIKDMLNYGDMPASSFNQGARGPIDITPRQVTVPDEILPTGSVNASRAQSVNDLAKTDAAPQQVVVDGQTYLQGTDANGVPTLTPIGPNRNVTEINKTPGATFSFDPSALYRDLGPQLPSSNVAGKADALPSFPGIQGRPAPTGSFITRGGTPEFGQFIDNSQLSTDETGSFTSPNASQSQLDAVEDALAKTRSLQQQTNLGTNWNNWVERKAAELGIDLADLDNVVARYDPPPAPAPTYNGPLPDYTYVGPRPQARPPVPASFTTRSTAPATAPFTSNIRNFVPSSDFFRNNPNMIRDRDGGDRRLLLPKTPPIEDVISDLPEIPDTPVKPDVPVEEDTFIPLPEVMNDTLASEDAVQEFIDTLPVAGETTIYDPLYSGVPYEQLAQGELSDMPIYYNRGGRIYKKSGGSSTSTPVDNGDGTSTVKGITFPNALPDLPDFIAPAPPNYTIPSASPLIAQYMGQFQPSQGSVTDPASGAQTGVLAGSGGNVKGGTPSAGWPPTEPRIGGGVKGGTPVAGVDPAPPVTPVSPVVPDMTAPPDPNVVVDIPTQPGGDYSPPVYVQDPSAGQPVEYNPDSSGAVTYGPDTSGAVTYGPDTPGQDLSSPTLDEWRAARRAYRDDWVANNPRDTYNSNELFRQARRSALQDWEAQNARPVTNAFATTTPTTPTTTAAPALTAPTAPVWSDYRNNDGFLGGLRSFSEAVRNYQSDLAAYLAQQRSAGMKYGGVASNSSIDNALRLARRV